ncbi:MAG: dihydropteroate synthase [Proteobacteria bacterium]|nr:dihydropteroate synthase [Pseudomonadota bacterium]
MLGRLAWDWSRTCVFGVLNVTPDSFFDGGRHATPESAVAHALALADEGAEVIDIGGESTRPGAAPVPLAQELDRVLPVIGALVGRLRVPIAVDTYKAEVASAALRAGATIVNDISGGRIDDALLGVVAAAEATVILGHLRGLPATMQQDIVFGDVVAEVIIELKQRVRAAIAAGVRADRIWVDPGLGFGKRADHVMSLLHALGRVREEVGYPLLIGPSRKSFIAAVTGQSVGERLIGSCGAAVAGVINGADGVRLHDVLELLPAIRVADAIRRASA